MKKKEAKLSRTERKEMKVQNNKLKRKRAIKASNTETTNINYRNVAYPGQSASSQTFVLTYNAGGI